VLDAQERLIIEWRKLEGEPANHKSIRLFQWRTGVDFFFGPAGPRDTRSFVADGQARQIKRQVEADNEASSFERRRQKSFVDKIMKVEGLDAGMLRRFDLQRLQLRRRNLVVEQAFLTAYSLLPKLIGPKAQPLTFVGCRLGIENEHKFRGIWSFGSRLFG
jgi:hypothetical protein